MIQAFIALLSKLFSALFYKKKVFTAQDVKQSVYDEKVNSVKQEIETIKKQEVVVKDLKDDQVVDYWKEQK